MRSAEQVNGSAGGPGGLQDAVFERLLGDRIVVLGSQVDDAVANQLAAQMLLLAAEDPKRDIHLYVNSPGGSVSAGMAVYDTMQFVDCDVATYGIGWPPPWVSSCSRPAPRASATRCRTRGS
jgi:ATP-dependent Clp protease protease subunit